MAAGKKQPRQASQVPVPTFVDDSNVYETWKKDIERWCLFSNLSGAKKALAIHFSLSGKASIASNQIPNDQLTVKRLLEVLDEIYLPDKVIRTVNIFQDMYDLRRESSMSIHDYICEFQQKYHRFQEVDGELPDKVLACMLLASCQLSEDKNQLVKTGLVDISFASMVATLKRVFGNENQNVRQPSADRSEVIQQVLYSEEPNNSEDTLYSARNKPYRGRGGFSSRNTSRGRPRKRFGGGPLNRNHQYSRNRLNPLGRDGEPTTCRICKSVFHYARDCTNTKDKDNDNNDRDKNRVINFSMFVGCASGKQNTKLKDLVYETNGFAILDSGCSNTVCGEKWLSTFIENLSDDDRHAMKFEPSNQTFTFGDGRTVTSKTKVTIPCWMGGLSGNIFADVVDCNIPLLLSRQSMKRVGMILDFKKDVAIVKDYPIPLTVTKSGHYALPISL